MNTSAVSALLDRELSARSRFAHVLLLLAAATMATITASLWATEPALPARTAAAFAVMTGMGLCWVAYAAWVLSARRVLLGRQRVVASALGTLFSAITLAGALAVGGLGGKPAAWLAALVFAGMTALAVVLLMRARRDYARLCQRRELLAQQLRSPAPD